MARADSVEGATPPKSMPPELAAQRRRDPPMMSLIFPLSDENLEHDQEVVNAVEACGFDLAWSEMGLGLRDLGFMRKDEGRITLAMRTTALAAVSGVLGVGLDEIGISLIQDDA